MPLIMTFVLRFLVLVAAVAVVFGRLLMPDQTLGGMDFLNLLYPHAFLVQRAFALGELPLWNWYQWGGAPLLATMQSASLYPPMWASLLLPLPYGLQLNLFAHLVLGAAGAAALTRLVFSTRTQVSLYAGVAYACSGFMLGHIEQPNSIAPACWAPWLFVAAVRFVLGTTPLRWFAGALALAILAGHPHHVALTLLFLEMLLGAWFLVQLRSPEGFGSVGARGFVLRVLKLQLGIILGAVVCAAQLFPTQELSSYSERVWPYPDPNAPALEWRLLPAAFIPRFYNYLSGTQGQPVAYSELGLYCGVLTAVLFLVGVGRLLRRRRSALGVALLITWLLSLLYALGKQGFVTPVIFRLVSFLGHSRGAARSLNIETLLFSLFGAYGLEGFLAWLARRSPDASASTQAPRPNTIFSPAGLGWLALAFLTADLALTHSPEFSSLFVSMEVLQAPNPTLRLLAENPSQAPRLYRFMANDSDFYLDHSPGAVYQREVRLQPNMNSLAAVPTTDGYEEGLLPTRHYANFLRRFNRNLRNDKLDASLLALMGTNTVLTEYPLSSPGKDWKLLQAPLRVAGRDYFVWRSAWQSAWFLDEQTLQRAASGRETSQNLSSSYFGADSSPAKGSTKSYWYEPLGQTPVVHPYASLTSQALSQAAQAAKLEFFERRTNSIRFASHSDERRPLLFMQSYYPGWKVGPEDARKNSFQKLTPEAPVFSSFIWPPLASPTHVRQVGVLRYEPFSFRLGLFITLVSLAAALAWMIGGRSFRSSAL